MSQEAPAAPRGRSSAAATLTLSIPVAMGYVPLGAVFGFLLVQAGGAWWLAPLMSLLVYAGAAQFAAVPLLAAGASLGTLVLTTAIINLRHVFYGLSLLHALPANRWARAALIWLLTDETYALVSTLPAGTPPRRMVQIALLNHGWWLLGTLLGALLGTRFTRAVTGIDFALAALFAVLVVEQWRATRRWLPFGVAALAYALASWLVPAQALAAAIGASLVAAVLLPQRDRSEPA
ncbi:MAG TPA: AzlC family ABC transporter permease [Ottowia sp.]|uniref:AzlC family ABC transporter permease n=1 Tax=Ottowia sp. TaxID=1898956 RepID=UPI002BF1C0FE|nr:AzlC family ABC transporter permease [Ottowia sp.]HMN21762.1 AzlC family ABC transporter permease [Ottowia sp.]